MLESWHGDIFYIFLGTWLYTVQGLFAPSNTWPPSIYVHSSSVYISLESLPSPIASRNNTTSLAGEYLTSWGQSIDPIDISYTFPNSRFLVCTRVGRTNTVRAKKFPPPRYRICTCLCPEAWGWTNWHGGSLGYSLFQVWFDGRL